MRRSSWPARAAVSLLLATVLVIATVGASAGAARAEEPVLKGSEARAHLGEDRTVCGTVASARYLDTSNRQPTFLNFDKPYPDHSFTVVIFGPNRAKFGEPEKAYQGKTVCATGRIEEFRGQPQIVVREPASLTLQPRAQ